MNFCWSILQEPSGKHINKSVKLILNISFTVLSVKLILNWFCKQELGMSPQLNLCIPDTQMGREKREESTSVRGGRMDSLSVTDTSNLFTEIRKIPIKAVIMAHRMWGHQHTSHMKEEKIWWQNQNPNRSKTLLFFLNNFVNFSHKKWTRID